MFPMKNVRCLCIDIQLCGIFILPQFPLFVNPFFKKVNEKGRKPEDFLPFLCMIIFT